MNDSGMDESGAEEITIEVDERTARRIRILAREFDKDWNDVAKRCCCYGVRDYEHALGVASDSG